MKALRDFVFDLVKADPQLNALGLTVDNLYPVYGRQDATYTIEGDRFMVLRWGPASVGIGPSNPVELAPWAYDISPEYSWIDAVLLRTRRLLEPLNDGAVLNPERTAFLSGVSWQGSGPDLFDDLYNRYTRSESYRLVASEH